MQMDVGGDAVVQHIIGYPISNNYFFGPVMYPQLASHWLIGLKCVPDVGCYSAVTSCSEITDGFEAVVINDSSRVVVASRCALVVDTIASVRYLKLA